MKKNFFDIWLAASFFILILIGIIMVYSASAFYAERMYQDHLYFLKKHFLWLLIGLAAFAMAYKVPYKRLQCFCWMLMPISLALLFYLAFIQHGRWINLGLFHLQGVDVAKFSIIFFLADSLTRREKILKNFSEGLFPHLVYLMLFAILVVVQPDFSSAALLIMIGLTMLWVSPVKWGHLVLTTLVILPMMVFVIVLSPYKMSRILAFLHPERDLQGKGYQVYQSLISLGSGGINGVGFAQGKQKLFFLPEAHTDFIFSIIGEEWGLRGTLLIVILFGIIMVRGIKIARRSLDAFSFYLAVGITAHFVWYGLINMAVTLNLLPPTGLPLPFISYGGTSLVFSCIYAGLLLNIAAKNLSDSPRCDYTAWERYPGKLSIPKTGKT